MRLLLDDRWLHDGGIGRQARNLLARRPGNVEIEYLGKTWAIKDPLSPYRLAREINRRQPDKFWSPGFMPPLPTRTPNSVFIYDLIHLEFGSSLQKFYYDNVIRPLALRCETIFTCSEYSKKILSEWLKGKDDRIVVIPCCVGEEFFNAKNTFKLEKPYFLYVGNRRVYKNIDRMLEAFARSGLQKDFFFYLSGKPDQTTNRIIEKHKLEGAVIFGGFIDEETLPSVYRGAVSLVFISLNEGFGMPNIEAFASGTVTITSDRTAIPEVVGDAGILVNPFDIGEISEAMNTVARDQNIRDDKILKGKMRAKLYSWENSASLFWARILS